MRAAGLIALGAVLAVAGTASTCGTSQVVPSSRSDVTVKVEVVPPEPDSRIKFSGSIGNSDGQRTVQGLAPMTFTIPADRIAIAVIQMNVASRPGRSFRVSLIGCPDGLPHSQSTTADYGVVTVSCH